MTTLVPTVDYPPTPTNGGLAFEISKGGTLYIRYEETKIFPPSAEDLLQQLPQAVGIRERSCCTFWSHVTLLGSTRARLNSTKNLEFVRRKNDTKITEISETISLRHKMDSDSLAHIQVFLYQGKLKKFDFLRSKRNTSEQLVFTIVDFPSYTLLLHRIDWLYR